MKPLNVLPKFENHFANQTVRFQVQLEADGYFSAQKFSSLHPQQAGRVGTNSQFFESVFYKSDFKNTCWASPKPNIQCKNHAERANFLREKRFSKIGVDSFNIASNRNYYFRFWRQKAEVSLPKNLSNFMVCSIQNIFQEAEAFLPVFPWVSPKIHWKPEGMHTTQNCAVTVCKNAKDDCAETSSMIAQKCTPNQRNKSNLKDSHPIRTTDAHLTFGEWIKKYF